MLSHLTGDPPAEEKKDPSAAIASTIALRIVSGPAAVSDQGRGEEGDAQ